MDGKQTATLIAAAQAIVTSSWTGIIKQSPIVEARNFPEAIREAIERSINSRTKTYRYVLPTQLLAVLTDSTLDCRAIQEGSGLAGAFDARSLFPRVIVPFDRQNHNVLGGSTEPYVNNPLRIPAVLPQYSGPQKDKAGFKDLCNVLGYAHRHKSEVGALFSAVLAAIARRLVGTHIIYPVPNRISLEQTMYVLESFLGSRSGGVRLQIVSVALFRCMGQLLNLFSKVRSGILMQQTRAQARLRTLSALRRTGISPWQSK